MTEEEWLTCPNPEVLLAFSRGRVADRKLRLFACACCRRIWHLPDSLVEAHRAVETAELYADGLVGDDVIEEAERVAWGAWNPDEGTVREQMGFGATAAFASTTGRTFQFPNPNGGVIQRETWEFINDSLASVLWIAGHEQDKGRFEPKRDRRFRNETADMMRCVIGNPFRPVAFDSAWLTSTVVAIGQGMYESRDFGAMPILADALQDAGCDNADILDHCRGAGPHVRGCWVIDQLLGKK